MALFVAIELDDQTRGLLVGAMAELASDASALRLERPEKLHVTLAYLGKIGADRFDDFARALDLAAGRCSAFDIDFDHLGPFGSARTQRILALTCSRPQRGFNACASAVRAEYESLGIRFEHEPVAHVTVARARNGIGGTIDRSLPCLLAVRELVLFESVPAGPTTRYEKRSTALLQTKE